MDTPSSWVSTMSTQNVCFCAEIRNLLCRYEPCLYSLVNFVQEILTSLLPLIDRLLSLDSDFMSKMVSDCLATLIIKLFPAEKYQYFSYFYKHMFWVLIRSAFRGTSNECTQHMFSWRNKTKYMYTHISGAMLTFCF